MNGLIISKYYLWKALLELLGEKKVNRSYETLSALFELGLLGGERLGQGLSVDTTWHILFDDVIRSDHVAPTRMQKKENNNPLKSTTCIEPLPVHVFLTNPFFCHRMKGHNQSFCSIPIWSRYYCQWRHHRWLRHLIMSESRYRASGQPKHSFQSTRVRPNLLSFASYFHRLVRRTRPFESSQKKLIFVPTWDDVIRYVIK